MNGITLLTKVLLYAQLASSLSIEIPAPIEPRDALQARAADPRDEVVYLADCRKYKDKNADEKNIMEHISYVLYHDTFDYTRNNKSFSWGARATPSYPNGQRVDAMGGAFVDWVSGKQDDKIEAKFDTLERRFWVHSLSNDGDRVTKATGIASLGDHDMRCYKDPTNINMNFNNYHYKCIANYYCTRSKRQIRRTLFSISEQTVDVQIVAKSPGELKLPAGSRSDRVDGVISSVYYWVSTLDPKQGSVVNEMVIDHELKRQTGKTYHSVRFNWKVGQTSSDPSYDPSRIKSIAQHLQKNLNPEIEQKVKTAGIPYWDYDSLLYKAPFPANVNVQIQIAFQDQLDWKATDTIDIDIISHREKSCGDGAAWAKVLSGLFGGAAALASGGASAVLSGLGGIAGGYHTAACLSS